jgi:hypothetical protein
MVCQNLEILGQPNPGHVYAHPICPRPAVVVAALCHLNNIAINIHARAQTLQAVGQMPMYVF